MRISIFSAFYPFRGGIAQFNARLFRALEKKNEVSAFTFTTQYPKILFPGKTQFVSPEDHADAIPAERIVNPFNPFSYPKAIKRIQKKSPDIFVVNYWMTFFGICFGILAKYQSKQIKKIAIIHNLIPHEERFFDRMFSRFFIKNYDGFIVLSEAVKIDLLNLKPDAKIFQIAHPWYDHFGEKEDRNLAHEKLGLDPQMKTLLFFGLIRDYKGLDLLIEAFGFLPGNFQLVIAGEVYGKEGEYQKQIKESKAHDRIIFHNKYINDEMVRWYFSAADVCVLPYRSATQSGITAVSFHFEVPVVATNVGGLKENIESIEAGVVVDEISARSIAIGVEEMFAPGRITTFSDNLRKAKKLNSWDHFADELISFATKI